MTEPELQQMRDTLAREVMGWELIESSLGMAWYWSNDGVKYLYVQQTIGCLPSEFGCWKPDQNIEQAMMVLEKFAKWKLWRACPALGHQKYGCLISEPRESFYVTDETKELAICQAAIKTLEVKDDKKS